VIKDIALSAIMDGIDRKHIERKRLIFIPNRAKKKS